MFGTHEAKFQLKKWAEDHGLERIERFSQSIGDTPYSEIELRVPGASVDDQVATLSKAFETFTGAPLDAAVGERFRAAGTPQLGLVVRISSGKISLVGGIAQGVSIQEAERLCTDAKVPMDPKLPKLVGALGESIVGVQYVRAGERAGVDIYLEPSEPGEKPAAQPDTN
jgi:hypothetical protein